MFYGVDVIYVFQVGIMWMDGSPMCPWRTGKPRNYRVCFIGRGVEDMGIKEGFESCKV